jgi:hypothetical protein
VLIKLNVNTENFFLIFFVQYYKSTNVIFCFFVLFIFTVKVSGYELYMSLGVREEVGTEETNLFRGYRGGRR